MAHKTKEKKIKKNIKFKKAIPFNEKDSTKLKFMFWKRIMWNIYVYQNETDKEKTKENKYFRFYYISYELYVVFAAKCLVGVTNAFSRSALCQTGARKSKHIVYWFFLYASHHSSDIVVMMLKIIK